MDDPILSHDDPRLTAYALGELDDVETAEVEAALRRNPALRATVEEIRGTAAQLEIALAGEPEAESIAAAAAASPMHRPRPDPYRRKSGGLAKLIQFPQIYYVVGTVAAACFAIVALLRTPPPVPAVARVSRGAVDPASVPVRIITRDEDGTPKTMAVGVTVAPADVTALPAEPLAPPAGQSTQNPNGSRRGDGNLANASGGRLLNTPRSDGTQPGDTGAPAGSTPEAISPPTNLTAGVDTPRPATETTAVPVGSETKPFSTTFQPDPIVRLADAGSMPPERTAVPDPLSPRSANPVGDMPGMLPAAIPPVVPPVIDQPADSARVVAANPKPATKAPTEEPLVPLDAITIASERENPGVVQSFTANARKGARGKPLAPRGAQFSLVPARRALNRDNDFLPADENPKSMFPAEVGSSSYAAVRTAIESGRRPPRDVVKIEELVNYFPYRYPVPPERDEKPFAAALEVTEAPWAPTHRLIRIGLQGRQVSSADQQLSIAKDVRIEVTFNPAQVSSYRLIGFESPRLNPDDYERTDGAEIPAGHAITALYEIVPVGAEERHTAEQPSSASLLYQNSVVVSSRLETATMTKSLTNEMAMVTVAYMRPTGIFNYVRHDDFGVVDTGRRFADATADFKFAAAVAGFGMILRDSPHKGSATLGDVVAWAGAGAASNADDPRGYRGEFIELARKARAVLR